MNETHFTHRPLSDDSPAEHRLERGLASIYRDPDGRGTDLSRLDAVRIRPSHRAPWVLLGVGVLLLLVWFGSGQFTSAKFGEEQVDFSVAGPSMLKAGEIGTWTVSWKNHSTAQLTNVALNLERTPSFELKDTLPAVADANAGSWSVTDTASGASGSFEFHGRLWAQPGADVSLGLVLAFTPRDWGARFQRRVRVSSRVVESTLQTTIDGPTQIIGGGQRSYTVHVENTAPDPVAGVTVVVTPPSSFTVSNTSPDTPDIGGVLTVRNIDIVGGAAMALSISGSYVQAPTLLSLSANNWKVETSIRPGQGLEDVLQNTAVLPIAIAQGDMLLTTLVGDSADARAVDPGSSVPVAVSLKNQGTADAEDVVVKIVVVPVPDAASSLLDWSNAVPIGAQRVDNAIVYSADQFPSLLRMPGGGSRADLRASLSFFKNIDPTVRALGDLAFDVKAVATIGKLGGVVEPKEVSSNVVRVRLNSDVGVSANARYFTDENLAVGSGPLPPRVGQATNVRVLWNVTNSLHELTGLSMTAVLPEGVVWTGNARVAAGTIQFDANSREIRWTVNRMPTSVSSLDAQFELSVVPTDSDVGSLILLAKKVAFQAEDATTHAVFARTLENLTTNLVGDPFASGKGVVVR